MSEKSPDQFSQIEAKCNDLKLEVAFASEISVVALLQNPSSAQRVMEKFKEVPDCSVHLFAMPEPNGHPEWAIVMPRAYETFVLNHIKDDLKYKGYCEKADVLKTIETVDL